MVRSIYIKGGGGSPIRLAVGIIGIEWEGAWQTLPSLSKPLYRLVLSTEWNPVAVHVTSDTRLLREGLSSGCLQTVKPKVTNL